MSEQLLGEIYVPLCCTATNARTVGLKRENTLFQILQNWRRMRNKQHIHQHKSGKQTLELGLSVK